MKTEQAKQLTQKALDELSASLEAGKSESLLAYLQAMSHFHKYSFGNIMLIWHQRPDATHVAGFRTWKKLGRYVRRGETGIVIFAPMLVKSKERDDARESDEQPEKALRFRAVHVFDIAQTEGEPLPEPATVTGNPSEYSDRLKAFAISRNIRFEYAETPMLGALGVSKGGTIVIKENLEPAEEFSVFVHELAHEMLHRDPETRPKSRKVREVEAESVAFVVCRTIGLETGTASSDYIHLYQGDADTLAASLDRIQRASAEIIEALSDDRIADTAAFQPASESREEVRP